MAANCCPRRPQCADAYYWWPRSLCMTSDCVKMGNSVWYAQWGVKSLKAGRAEVKCGPRNNSWAPRSHPTHNVSRGVSFGSWCSVTIICGDQMIRISIYTIEQWLGPDPKWDLILDWWMHGTLTLVWVGYNWNCVYWGSYRLCRRAVGYIAGGDLCNTWISMELGVIHTVWQPAMVVINKTG